MSTITAFIKKLTKEGGDGNFLIINLDGGAYMQFAANKGDNSIYCEAAGKFYDSGETLNPNQIAQLHKIGWTETSSTFEGNYGLNIELNENSLSQLEEMVHATANIYGSSEENYTYELVLE